MNMGRFYLLLEKWRVNKLIYIKPKRRILAAKPPYVQFAKIKKVRGLKIGMRVSELKERLASI